MGIKEYGQAASEVELQDNPGPIKNQEGESVVEVTNDGSFRILNESDTTKYVESAVLSNGQVTRELVGATTAGITFVRSGGIYSMHHYQETGDKVGGVYLDSVSQNGLSVGISSGSGFLKTRKSGSTLSIGAGDADAITIDGSTNATFVANLSANGNVTLGDATADAHVVNGTLRLASEYSSGPSAPADGAGGILYIKDDGKLYFISQDVSETDLTSGGGGGGLTHETKSADFTAAGNFFYSVNSSGGNIAVTLPAASTAGLAGQTVDICHRTIGNTITITRSASDLINGATTLTLSGIAFQNVTLFCTGAEWLIR